MHGKNISEILATTATAFQIHPSDNVATLLRQAGPEAIVVRGGPEARRLTLEEPIELGHKVAVASIPAGDAIVKFGVPIGGGEPGDRAGPVGPSA